MIVIDNKLVIGWSLEILEEEADCTEAFENF